MGGRKVFRVAAEQLSLHKAAEKRFLTQPAITLQIKALEEDLGLRLFDRAGRVSLTTLPDMFRKSLRIGRVSGDSIPSS